jgi:putative transposase
MQTYSALWVHLIWSTKNRQPIISQKLKYKLYDQIREICIDKTYHLDFINGIEDHIHLLISLSPKFSVSNVVKDIKGVSQRWVVESGLIEEYFEWQDGYAVVSVSPYNVQRVRNYIRNQEKHHKKMTAEDELNNIKELAFVPDDL